jgi:hypothetical protein
MPIAKIGAKEMNHDMHGGHGGHGMKKPSN